MKKQMITQLSEESPQAHIQRLFKERALNDPNSVTLANTLSKDIETLFKGAHKFIFELLQNADDTGDAKQQITVEFILSSDQLIFRHTGQPFNSTDVDKICDNAQQAHKDKISNSHKIGYKGIGFKALFSVADSVSIFSGGYSFQFNKHYSLWKTAPQHKPYPWPIIPIGLSPTEQVRFAQTGLATMAFQTVFIINIKNSEFVASEFSFIQKHPELMLFFRHVRAINLQQGKTTTLIELKSKPPSREILCNGKMTKMFIDSGSFEITIPESLRHELAKMSDFECPPKLKTAQAVPLQFAVQLQADGAKVQRATYPLYCYLPTTVNLNLPYLVNTDFLLKPDRGELLENIWNTFLLEQIAILHFYWLKNLTNTLYRDQILWLVGKDNVKASLLFQDAYLRGFNKGKDSIACIPSYLSKTDLLTLNQSIADTIGFWRSFPELKDSAYPTSHIVRYELEGLDEQKYFGKKFSAVELTKNLTNYAQQLRNFSEHKKLLMFLYDLSAQKSYDYNYYSSAGDPLSIKNIPFLICQNGRYAKPTETYYFPAQEKKSLELPETIKIDCLDPVLIRDNEKLINWLCQLGVRPFTPEQILKDEILPRLLDEKQSLAEHMALFKLAFQIITASEKSDQPFKQEEYGKNLRRIQVINVEKKFLAAEECYFHDDYKPKLPLMSFTKDQSQFLSILYLELGDEKQIKKFITRLGVRENLEIQYITPYSYKEALLSKKKLVIDYFDSHKNLNRKHNPNPSISVLIDLPILDFVLQSKQFSQAFWQQLIKNWSHLKKACKEVFYHSTGKRGGPSSCMIESFLQYRLKNSPCIQASDGQFYKSTECYSADFKKWQILPVIHQPDLPQDLIKFLGLRLALTTEDCVKLLTHYGEADSPNLDLYAGLFAHLAKQADFISYTIQKWQGRLPAQDNTLQPVTQLKFFGIKDRETPISSLWLKVITGISFKDRLKIAELFKIKVFTQEKPIVNIKNKKAEFDVLSVFIPLLPALAMVEDRTTNHPAAELLVQWHESLEQLQIYSVDQLELSWDPEEKISQKQCVYLEEASLYYKGQWRTKKTEVVIELARYLQCSPGTLKAATALISFELPKDKATLQEWLEEHDYSYSRYLDLISAKSQTAMSLPKQKSVSLKKEDKDLDTLSKLLKQTALAVIDEPLKDVKTIHSEQIVLSPRSTSLPKTHVLVKPKISTPKLAIKSSTLTAWSELPETISPFIPDVQPEEMDMQAVDFIQAKPSRLSSPGMLGMPQHTIGDSKNFLLPSKMSVKKTEMKNTTDIGYWGEQFVYVKLISHYCEKYSECTYTETSQGFKLNGHYQHNKLELEVVWLNKFGETGSSVDFKIIKNGRVRYIEVKTTQKSGQAEFFISSSEWRTLMEHGDRFRLFQVLKAGQKGACITKLKDPAAKIKTGDWIPQQARFKFSM